MSLRENERTIEELLAAVAGLFEIESWKRFERRNFERFQRYARDQSLEAKRFFASGEIDGEVLDKALAYCLENDTLSYANLKDTYRHFEREGRRPEPVTIVDAGVTGAHKALDVSRRQISDYEQAARERAVS